MKHLAAYYLTLAAFILLTGIGLTYLLFDSSRHDIAQFLLIGALLNGFLAWRYRPSNEKKS